jgi:hypothetical protein
MFNNKQALLFFRHKNREGEILDKKLMNRGSLKFDDGYNPCIPGPPCD